MPPFQRAIIRTARRRGCAAGSLLRLAAAGARQLSGQPRGRRASGAARPRIDVRASIFCTVREPVASSAVRLLRGGVHPAAGAVRPADARGSGRVPRHRRAWLCVLSMCRWATGASKPAEARRMRAATRSRVVRARARSGRRPAGAAAQTRPRAHPGDAVRERHARQPDLLAERSVGGAARRRSECARRQRDHPGGAARRRSNGCRCRRPPSLTDATVIRIGQLVGAAQVVVGIAAAARARRCVVRAEHRARSRAGCRPT